VATRTLLLRHQILTQTNGLVAAHQLDAHHLMNKKG
jgi:hypothetical protein